MSLPKCGMQQRIPRQLTLKGGGSSELNEIRSGLIVGAVAERIAQAAQIEDVLGRATRANRLDLAESEQVPIAITDLDIDPAIGAIGGQQHGRFLARALPAIGWGRRPDRAPLA